LDLGYRVRSSEFRSLGLEFGVSSLKSEIRGLGLGLRLRVKGLRA